MYLYTSLYVLTDFRLTQEDISYMIVAHKPAFGHLNKYFTFNNLNLCMGKTQGQEGTQQLANNLMAL